MSSTLHQFKYGANLKIVGKTEPQNLSYAGAFSPVTGTLEDLAAHISKGHPWMPALLSGSAKRWQSNANHAEVLAADIDSGMTIAQALEHPFIKAHCGLAIESSSSTPEHHKFRLVFRLENPLEDWETIRLCNRYLIEQLGTADPACKDASRFFFGAPGRIPFLLNDDAFLPQSFVDDAIAWHQAEEAALDKQYRAALERRSKYQGDKQDTAQLVQDALRFIPPRKQGTGNYPECMAVLCGLVHEFGETDAIAIAEGWSPSFKGDWNLPKKVASLRRGTARPATIGSLFHIAKSYGFRFPEKKLEQKDPREPNSQEPPRDEYNAFCTRLEEQQHIEALQSARLAETKRDHFRARTERIQAELNSLSSEPTIEAIGRYIPQGLLQLPDKPGIILVDATMGTGKTSTALKGLVQQHRSRYPKALEWLFTPRNLLGIQSGAILGLPHHSYSTSYPFQSSSCFESVGAIALDQLPDGAPLILCDEAGQSFKQILDGQTCKDSQPFVLERTRQLFKAVAERGGWIVLSEDGLTNLELDFVQEASGLEAVEHLKFTREVITPRTFEIYDHPSLTWDESLIRLERGENLLCFADNRKWLEETERMLAARGVERCFFIHSGNSQEEWVRDLMKNPTAWVEQNKPRFLGFTPSMGSGVSIDDPQGHFAAMAIHLSHLEPRQGKQGCDRLRTDVPRFGYVKERGASDDDLFSGSRPDLILRDLRRNQNGIAKLTQFAKYAGSKGADLLEALQRIDEDWENPGSELSFYLKHWSRYKARENYSKLFLRENLISIWEAQGHTVNLLQLGKVKHLAEERTEHRAALDQDEAIVFSAGDTSGTSLAEARDILNTLGETPEQRRVARKRLLQDKLPGINLDDAEFCLKAVIQHNGRFLKSAELLWKTQNPDAAKAIDRWNWSNAFSQSAQTGRIVIIHRLSNHSAQAELLHECPLQPFIDGKVQQFDNNTPEAIAVRVWALLHNRQFRRHLRITVSENHTPVQTVNKLLRKLGFEVKKHSRKGSAGLQQWQYAITNLQDCDRDAILKALTERFISRCEEKGESQIVPLCREDYTHTNEDYDIKPWLTPESLEALRMDWEQADSEEVRAAIRSYVPLAVLQRAIA